MMKRKLVTIGYLLWGVAFLPTAAVVAALTGLPYFLAAYYFHWVNRVSCVLGLIFYVVLAGVFMALINWVDEECHYPYGGWKSHYAYYNYYNMIGISGLLSCAFFIVCCSGVMLHATFLAYVLWLGTPLACAVSASLIYFVEAAKNEFRRRLVSYCSYPKDRKILIRVATDHRYNCRAALDKLPYPQERETLVQVALNDKDRDTRLGALDKLPYPQERETLVQVALNGKDFDNRWTALEKLPYPQERNTIAQVALYDKDANIRRAALQKLSYPQERDVLVRMALFDGFCGDMALKKLPYPQNKGAEAIVKAALHDIMAVDCNESLPQTPHHDEQEKYLPVINFYENIIQYAFHKEIEASNPVLQSAASTLSELYQKTNSPKSISRKSIHEDYSDSHTDYDDRGIYTDYCGCGAYERDEALHTDEATGTSHKRFSYFIVEPSK